MSDPTQGQDSAYLRTWLEQNPDAPASLRAQVLGLAERLERGQDAGEELDGFGGSVRRARETIE